MSISTSDSADAGNAAIPPAVQSELTALRNDLAETQIRLAQLEQTAGNVSPTLMSLNSPEMQYALQLCQELYPGCRVIPEVMSDPDDPGRRWYSLNIAWNGSIQKLLALDMSWHRRFDERFPHSSQDFCLNSLPE